MDGQATSTATVFDDIVIGEYTATPNGNNSGETYVVFGTDQGFDPEAEFTALDGIQRVSRARHQR